MTNCQESSPKNATERRTFRSRNCIDFVFQECLPYDVTVQNDGNDGFRALKSSLSLFQKYASNHLNFRKRVTEPKSPGQSFVLERPATGIVDEQPPQLELLPLHILTNKIDT